MKLLVMCLGRLLEPDKFSDTTPCFHQPDLLLSTDLAATALATVIRQNAHTLKYRDQRPTRDGALVRGTARRHGRSW